MEPISLGVVVTLAIIIGGAVWKLSGRLRRIELDITNHAATERKEMRISLEKKLDRLESKIDLIQEDIAKCPYKKL